MRAELVMYWKGLARLPSFMISAVAASQAGLSMEGCRTNAEAGVKEYTRMWPRTESIEMKGKMLYGTMDSLEVLVCNPS